MRLYEYEGKTLFRRNKIPVPQNVLIEGVETQSIASLLKVVYPVVLKAQVFIGKRGEAGGIKFANSEKEAIKEINELTGKTINGFEVKKILVEEKIDIERELYISATIDRKLHKPLIIASREGGMDIEELAKNNPSKIIKHYLEIGEKPEPWVGRQIAKDIGINGALLAKAGEIINNIYTLFLKYDCKLVEINPLVLTKISSGQGTRATQEVEGEFVALDSKVDLDEDAMFRHPELKELGISARHEVGELTPREQIAKKANFPYVELDGDIGVFPGGAGFGIASIDLITKFGGKPANFMDSGGAPTQDKLNLMIDLLMKNPKVKVIFGARFGGISRCDDWAQAVVNYIVEHKPTKPMIMRMAGNMEKEGREIFEKAKKEHPDLFKNIKVYKFDTPIEEVIKEAIKTAKL